MSEKYLPLYRKYRPQSFKDLIGQENVTKALSNAINLGKISHAYLFCGPRGTGKTSSARIFAKSLNCIEGPTVTPCNKCSSCVDITNSTPVDVIEIDAASNRSVEDTQKILEKIQYVPIQGKYKIYIIDEVHMLSTTAFNSLLKTLEEPPENVIFILATTESHKVLETIVSRCQRFDFRRITTSDIIKKLEEIAKTENISITKEAVGAIAKNAQGGMRDALALLDQISIYGIGREISVEDIDKMLGRLSTDKLFALAECFVEKSVQKAVELVNEVYNKGPEPLQIVSNLISYYRNLLVIKNCETIDIAVALTELDAANIEKIKPQASKHASNEIVEAIDRLSHYAKQIKDTTNRHLWLEICAIELSSPKSASVEPIQVERVVKTTEPVVMQKPEPAKQAELEEPLPPKQAPVAEQKHVEVAETTEQKEEPAPQKETEEPKPQTQGFSTNWSTIVQHIKSVPAKMFFNGLAKPVTISDSKIKLAFSNENLANQAKEGFKFNALKDACKEVFGVNDISIEILTGTPLSKHKPEAQPISETPKPLITEEKQQEDLPITSEEPVFQEELPEEEPEETTIPQPLKVEPKQTYDDLSEQTRMVTELFSGKIID